MPRLSMKNATEWLAPKLHESEGEAVSYTRGATTITTGADGESLKAMVGNRRNREEPQGDARLILDGEPLDFLFKPGDLTISGSTITPATGDRITWASRTYDVRPVDGEPAQRTSDPWGNLLRVHTIRKS